MPRRPKRVGPMPRAVVHCRTTEDVQLAIRLARDCGVPLSVRGGGHHWAGLALCAGIVIDLSGMNGVSVDADHLSAVISGGAHAADVAAVADPLHVAAVTGTCSAVGMAGFTLGGGYGPLIGRHGLALDNLLAAEVVLADGRVVVASRDNEQELLWGCDYERRDRSRYPAGTRTSTNVRPDETEIHAVSMACHTAVVSHR